MLLRTQHLLVLQRFNELLAHYQQNVYSPASSYSVTPHRSTLLCFVSNHETLSGPRAVSQGIERRSAPLCWVERLEAFSSTLPKLSSDSFLQRTLTVRSFHLALFVYTTASVCEITVTPWLLLRLHLLNTNSSLSIKVYRLSLV